MSLDPVDQTTWKFPLYLRIDEAGGSASITPPDGWDDTVVHHLGVDEPAQTNVEITP